MKAHEKMILESRISILENALNDVKHMLISIDFEGDEPVAGAYARCAYARIESALNVSTAAGESI
jgi:hypothetical protein